jgi:hypothetical protein
MVQRDQWDTSWGPNKLIFLIREIDDATMAGASVESCRFVVLRSLGGFSGSVRDMCNRLRRMRGRFPLQVHLPRCISSHLTTRSQIYPRASPGADLPAKKVTNLGPMAPVPVKNVNYPRAPRNRNSGLVGPHTTPAIVNYKYMTSTRREGYFGPTALGT